MIFQTGDKVLVVKKEKRIDDQIIYAKFVGMVIEAFNACDDDGDHWQYRIRGLRGEYLSFHEGVDEGQLTIIK